MKYYPLDFQIIFFDGEKIESLADLSASKDILNDAINTLLGLDITDRLINDLGYLKEKNKKQHLTPKLCSALRLKKKTYKIY